MVDIRGPLEVTCDGFIYRLGPINKQGLRSLEQTKPIPIEHGEVLRVKTPEVGKPLSFSNTSGSLQGETRKVQAIRQRHVCDCTCPQCENGSHCRKGDCWI